MSVETSLEQYRDYLGLLGRMQVDDQLAGKVDVSGVVQQTLFEAYKQASQWQKMEDDGRVAWLRRVFANNLLDEIRRFRAQSRDVARERAIKQSLEQSASRLEYMLIDPKSSPSQQAMRSERALRLTKALACLTPPQREAIELHHLQGLPLADVGRQMKREKGAVAALIFRGTRRLRELMTPDL